MPATKSTAARKRAAAKSSVPAKKLTATQTTLVGKAVNKGSKFYSGKAVPGRVLKRVYKALEKVMQRRKPIIGNEAIALWSAKIDFAIANGDRPTVGRLITLSALTS